MTEQTIKKWPADTSQPKRLRLGDIVEFEAEVSIEPMDTEGAMFCATHGGAGPSRDTCPHCKSHDERNTDGWKWADWPKDDNFGS